MTWYFKKGIENAIGINSFLFFFTEFQRSKNSTCKYSLFGNEVFVDNQVKMESLKWVLIQYDCVLIKEFGCGGRHTLAGKVT